MTAATLTVSPEQIAEFCRRHHIRWLAVFGSAARDDFGPDSDVDVLVEFEPGHTPGLAFIDIQDELSALFGNHPVDLATRRSLNRWIRNRVLAEAVVLYDAARRSPLPPSYARVRFEVLASGQSTIREGVTDPPFQATRIDLTGRSAPVLNVS